MGELSHQPCPYVDCGSSDAFSWNDKGFGKCHSCNKSYPTSGKQEVYDWVHDKYQLKNDNPFGGNKDWYMEMDTQQNKNQSGRYIFYRGITAKTMEVFDTKIFESVKFCTRVGKDEYRDGVSDELRFPYPSGSYKIRRLNLDKKDKAHFAVGKSPDGVRDVDYLFGMDKFVPGSSRKLTIVEGEIDALSAYQMLNNGSYLNVVVSLPSATPSKKMWEACFDWVNTFDEIYLSIDNDEPGNAICDKIARMFPKKVKRVNHGNFKDANDFLQAGKQKEYVSAWFNARPYTPDNVLSSVEDFMDLYDNTPEFEYMETGIGDLDCKILGLMQAHFTVFKAPTGIGKTELMRYLEYQMHKQGIPFATWHLEETKLRSLLGLVSYELNDNLTRRDLIEYKNRDEDVRRAITTLTKDGNIYQFFLPDGQGADELIEQIRFLTQACGVRFIMFEPIQDVISGLTDENKEKALADLAVRLSRLAAELNIGIVTIAHTNEDGAVKYCKMIEQRASVVIRLERDKEATDYEERNTTTLYIEKNRPTAEVGYGGKLKFNPETFTLKEAV